MRLLSGNLILDAGENAQLSFDGHVILVSVVDNLLCEGDVLLVREGGSIDHN